MSKDNNKLKALCIRIEVLEKLVQKMDRDFKDAINDNGPNINTSIVEDMASDISGRRHMISEGDKEFWEPINKD